MLTYAIGFIHQFWRLSCVYANRKIESIADEAHSPTAVYEISFVTDGDGIYICSCAMSNIYFCGGLFI